MDDSITRRLREAEQRITSLERMLAAKVERPAVTNFPRDRWLGGDCSHRERLSDRERRNTFGVKLPRRPTAPGPRPSTVTQTGAGTTKIARTWPSRYVAEGRKSSSIGCAERLKAASGGSRPRRANTSPR